MELSHYASILRRRWWLIVAVTVLSFLAASLAALRGPCAFQSNMRMAVSVIPEPRRDAYYNYDGYYPWLASEYLADDLSELIRSQAFAQDVSADLGFTVDPATLSSVTRTKKTHRMLDVTVCGSDGPSTLAIGEAYARVVNSRLGEYMAMLQANNGYVRIINQPTLGRGSSSLSLVGELVLRTAIGSLLAVALVFLLDYLDNRLRGRRDVEELLAWPILAEIPSART